MRIIRVRALKSLIAFAVFASATGFSLVAAPTASAAAFTLPPAHAAFDYQIGGAYTPPSGVKVVSRDYTAQPAAGLYNICYVNAFQAQTGSESSWGDLLLRDGNGDVVTDPDWDEALLDLRTADKRTRVAAKVDSWVDSCKAKGFQAVEPDNYDSYSRSQGLISTTQAQQYIQLLSAHAHAQGLAIAQKNTSDLAGSRVQNGLDFAIAEQCGQYTECDSYTSAFGAHVIVIEYTSKGLSKACSSWGTTLSIVERDLDVTTPGSGKYLRKTC
jgi:hypothetical protein